MGLIKVLEYGFGSDGKTLNFTISVPNKCYINHFYIATNSDVLKYKTTNVIDVFQEVKKVFPDYSDKQIFDMMFLYKEQIHSDNSKKTLDVYQLKDNFIWNTNVGITVDSSKLYFITLQLYVNPETTYQILPICGEDTNILVHPIYNDLNLKLDVLKYAKINHNCNCSINREFIDKLLQIKAFDLAINLCDYIFAAELWEKLYKNKTNKSNCQCNGN